MTNGRPELTVEQEQQLLGCYATLHEIARDCAVPAVSAAVRMAIAELHSALDGQALEFEYYSHRWSAPTADPVPAPAPLTAS